MATTIEETGGHRRTYLPAAGHDWFLPLYDPFVKLVGGDRARRALLEQAEMRPGQRVLDVGCGTGSLVVLINASRTTARPPRENFARAGRVRATGAPPNPASPRQIHQELVALAVRRERAAGPGLGVDNMGVDNMMDAIGSSGPLGCP